MDDWYAAGSTERYGRYVLLPNRISYVHRLVVKAREPEARLRFVPQERWPPRDE